MLERTYAVDVIVAEYDDGDSDLVRKLADQRLDNLLKRKIVELNTLSYIVDNGKMFVVMSEQPILYFVSTSDNYCIDGQIQTKNLVAQKTYC